MDITLVLRPAIWFLLATIIFFVGIQQTGYNRRLYAVLHITAISVCFSEQIQRPVKLPASLVAFLVGWTVHTTGILFTYNIGSQFHSLRFLEKFKTITLIWIDFRGIQRNNGVLRPEKNIPKDGFVFGAKKTARALVFFLLDHGITQYLLRPLLEDLALTPDDFSSAKQGLLPELLEKKDLILRAVTSMQWIWTTYLLLTALHDLCAVLFISILRWSDKSDWPPLFASFQQAYSLRRFWGIFWHCLHITPFAAFTPSIFDYHGDPLRRGATMKKVLWSFWIFLMSAACHGAVNLVVYRQAHLMTEIRFFLCNWTVCLVETLLSQATKRMKKQFAGSLGPRWAIEVVGRICGYIFVLGFFFCTVPAWRYPLV